MDCLAQTVDRALSGQTVDRLRKAWIKLAQSVDVGQTVDSYWGVWKNWKRKTDSEGGNGKRKNT